MSMSNQTHIHTNEYTHTRNTPYRQRNCASWERENTIRMQRPNNQFVAILSETPIHTHAEREILCDQINWQARTHKYSVLIIGDNIPYRQLMIIVMKRQVRAYSRNFLAIVNSCCVRQGIPDRLWVIICTEFRWLERVTFFISFSNFSLVLLYTLRDFGFLVFHANVRPIFISVFISLVDSTNSRRRKNNQIPEVECWMTG